MKISAIALGQPLRLPLRSAFPSSSPHLPRIPHHVYTVNNHRKQNKVKNLPVVNRSNGGFCHDLGLCEAWWRGSRYGGEFSNVVPMRLVGFYSASLLNGRLSVFWGALLVGTASGICPHPPQKKRLLLYKHGGVGT